MSALLLVVAVAVVRAPDPIADPLAALPAIAWHTPEEVGDAWRLAREAKGAGAKLRAVVAAGLPAWVCTGLVDLQALDASAEAGLVWKDVVRGRGWARPALARLLVEAHRAPAWQAVARRPGRAIAVGDVAQAGCGLVDPGVLTRVVRGPDARALLAAATLVAGRPVVRELARGDELADAPGRFAPDAPILVDRQVDARAEGDGPLASPVLLVRTRRYGAEPAPTPGEVQALERDIAGILARAELGFATAGDGLVREHWVDAATRRQLVIVRRADTVAADRKAGFQLGNALDVRIGPWANDRPGAFRTEVRWVVDPGGAWERWRLVEEGSHATHQTGRDADLSYPVSDAGKRFLDTPDAVAAVDIPATWRWFQQLAATSDSLGLGLERIIVGPRILARLLGEIPEARRSPLVAGKVIRVVAGHDDHMHVRVAVPADALDAASREALMRPASAAREVVAPGAPGADAATPPAATP